MEKRHKILSSIRNPLSMIALFVLFVEIIASFTLTNNSLTDGQRWTFVIFCIVFPILLLLIFSFLVWYHPEHFYAPSDYSNDESFLKAMKIGKIEDEVDEIIQKEEETEEPESRMQATSWLHKAEKVAIDELMKEFNCPISLQVLSDDKSYLFDAVIRKGRQLIFIDVKYIRNRFISSNALMHIKRFAESIDIGSKLLAIVTPEFLDDSTKNKYKETIAKIDNSIELRFYKL